MLVKQWLNLLFFVVSKPPRNANPSTLQASGSRQRSSGGEREGRCQEESPVRNLSSMRAPNVPSSNLNRFDEVENPNLQRLQGRGQQRTAKQPRPEDWNERRLVSLSSTSRVGNEESVNVEGNMGADGTASMEEEVNSPSLHFLNARVNVYLCYFGL